MVFFKESINKLSIKKIFLIDSIGALFSTFMHGFILAYFEEYIGVPKDILYKLAIVAFVFFVYSFTSFIRGKQQKPLFLKTIAILNISFCIITFYLLFHYSDTMSFLGYWYFISEIILVVLLAKVEITIASRN